MPHRTKREDDRRVADACETAKPSQQEANQTLRQSEGDFNAAEAAKDALTLDYLVTIIGFGLCRAWIIFCLGAPLVAGATASLHWMYLVFGALSALIVSFAVNRQGKHGNAVRVGMFRITPFALLASGLLIPLAIWVDNEALIALGFVAGGLGAGPLQVLWGDRFAGHPTRFAALASPAAAIVTALVTAMSTDNTSFVGFAVIPLLSFGLLMFEANRTGCPWRTLVKSAGKPYGESTPDAPVEPCETAGGNSERHQMGLGVGKLMFSIMTFSFLCRLFDAAPRQDDPFAFIGGSAIFAIIVVGVVFLGIVAKLKDKFDPSLTYRLSLPIMVAGFVAIALFVDTHAAASILLINIGYEFFDILAWILFADVSRRKNENALHIFGLGVAFMFVGMALGNLAGGVLNPLVADGSVQITAVAMLATLCLVIVAFMVLPEGVITQLSGTKHSGRKDREPESPRPDNAEKPAEAEVSGRLESRCAAVAQDFGLTPRESEVIVLLAYGRTLSIIARDLQIAKGTARTHIENIYRKLDVHKQQELIDLVEGYEIS